MSKIRSSSRPGSGPYENARLISSDPAQVFAYITDHSRLVSHMNKSSWMMGGGHMDTKVDDGLGQKVGSHILMRGKVFGIGIYLDEVITNFESPRLKVWATVREPKLLVIGQYPMKARTDLKENGTELQVSIDYNPPKTHAWLCTLCGSYYAKWCVQQMIRDTSDHFKK
jgi:hypothetical protein